MHAIPSEISQAIAAVDEDDDAELDIVAQPAATARGRVVDVSGKPCRGISVCLCARPRDRPTQERYRRNEVAAEPPLECWAACSAA